tara:strand:+ start:27 stop:386 length:360 start_codon:yes stop_codon:yes gene_type:complete
MADKSKKNIYRKTMGFTHNNTTSYTEHFQRQAKYFNALLKDKIQQAGSNKSIIGYKEPHKAVDNNAKFTHKRPPYKKDKFKGEVSGTEKSTLSVFGNKSKYNMDPYAVRKARRTLVKGT